MNYKKGTQTRGCMKSVMRYVSKLSKTLWDGQQLVSGIGCQPETAFDEFLSTKLLHHKDGGVDVLPHGAELPEAVRTLTRAQRTKRRGSLPDTSRAAKSWSARTPTANTSTRTASSTASILKPVKKCIWRTSRFRRCAFATTKSVRNWGFPNSREMSNDMFPWNVQRGILHGGQG